jgi:acetolactate synthase-1/2/3 large subunit
MPDFVKLAEAYGAEGIRAERPDELDDAIRAMINSKKPVLFDCVVAQNANCLPMIPSGKAHNEILLATDVTDEDIGDVIDAKGKQLV